MGIENLAGEGVVTTTDLGERTDLGDRVLTLSTRVASVLAAHPRTRELVAGLPAVDTSPLRIALLGPYSAGKSMLIAALLGLSGDEVDAIVDAAPKTQDPTPYMWEGVLLIDLPGTLSGDDDHAKKARLGMRGSDALMIVTTSELPGEAETSAILSALDEDGFADRSVVVVNKMNAENNDPGVIRDEVRHRLGSFADQVPIVLTDARDYVDAANDPSLTERQRGLLSAESQIDTLVHELKRIIEPGVEVVRPRAQAFEIARVLADAQAQWALDSQESSAVERAKKIEQSIDQAQETLLSALEEQSNVVASVIRAEGSKIVSAVSVKDGSIPNDILRDADRNRTKSLATFDTNLAVSMSAASDALTAKYGSRVPAPQEWANDLESHSTTMDGSVTEESRLERASKEAAKAGVRATSDWIRKVATGGTLEGSSASKIATRINDSRIGQKALDIGGKVGAGKGKFKPWGHGKATEKVAKTAGKAQWVTMAIGPALDLTGLVDDQVRRKKIDNRRKKIKERFDDQASTVRTALADSGTQWINAWISNVAQSLDELMNQGVEISAERDSALRELELHCLEVAELTKIAGVRRFA